MISGSLRSQDLPGSQTTPGLPEHPRTPRPSQGPEDPGSPGPKSARQAAHSELLAEGVTRPAGLLWDHFVPPVAGRFPLIWAHRWRSMAQHGARSKMAFWGDLPSEACFAPDSLDLGTPERTLGGLTFQSCFAPDSIDLGAQTTKTTSSTAARTLPTTRAGGQDDGS